MKRNKPWLRIVALIVISLTSCKKEEITDQHLVSVKVEITESVAYNVEFTNASGSIEKVEVTNDDFEKQFMVDAGFEGSFKITGILKSDGQVKSTVTTTDPDGKETNNFNEESEGTPFATELPFWHEGAFKL